MTESWRKYARPFARRRKAYRAAWDYAASQSKHPEDHFGRWAEIHAYMAAAVGAAWQDFVAHMSREGKL